MLNSKRDRTNDASPPKRPRFPFKTIAGSAALLGAVGVTGAGWKAWSFIQKDLAPMVSDSLSQSINRPVQVGELQGFSLQGLQFGPSAVPPVTSQSSSGKIDEDSATVEAVKVGFNLWETLLSRTLTLDLTLVEPQAYISQTADGAWIETALTPGEDGFLKLEIERIKLENGDVTAKPFQGPARTLNDLNGTLSVADNNEKATFNLAGTLDSGGQIQTQGQWSSVTQRLALKTKTQEVSIPPLLGFAPELPMDIRSGKATGEFQLVYSPQQPLEVQADAEITNGNVWLPAQQIDVAAKTLDADLKVIVSPQQTPKISGQVAVKQAKANVPEDLILQTGRSQVQTAEQVNGTLTFLDQSEQARFDLTGRLRTGGTFNTQGVTALDLSKTNIALRAQAVPAKLMDRAYQLPVNVTDGTVNANLLVKLEKDQKPYLKGWAQLNNVDAAIPQMPNQFFDANGYVRVEGLAAKLDSVEARYGDVPLLAEGTIDPDRGYQLSVNVPPTEINQALKTLQVAELPVPLQGQVRVPNLQVTGAITTPILTGTVLNQGEAMIDQVPFQKVSADFSLVLPEIKIRNIVAQPTDGGQATGTASYRLTDGSVQVDLKAAGIPGNDIAQRYGASPDLQVGAIAAQVKVTGQATSPQTLVSFQAPEAIYSTQGQLLVADGEMQLRNIVSQVAGGEVLTRGLIREGTLTAQVQPRNIALNQFSSELRGALNGSFAIATPLANFSPQTLRAEGDLTLSEGVSLIEAPIESAIAWNGSQVLIREAKAPGFNLSGAIGTSLDTPAGPQLTTLDLALNLDRFPLQSLADLGPTEIALGGTSSLNAQISGTVNTPRLDGKIAVNNLAVSQVPFESRLAGNLSYNSQGGSLNLRGDRDRIEVALAPDFMPNRFLVQRDEAIAQGRRQGNELVASVRQLPLQMLNLPPAFGVGALAGTASADLTANLTTYATQGSFAVQRPALGNAIGDRASGKFQYQAGLARLVDGTLEKDDSRYTLNASLNLDEDPDVSGELFIAKGDISDLLALAQGVTGSAPTLNRAEDLQLDSVGYPQAPLSIQLQRLTEIQTLIAQANEQQAQAPLALTDLTGEYDGRIGFQGSARDGIAGSFDLLGNDFRLGDYVVETAMVKGQLQNTTLNFEPLKLATGDRMIQYIGSLGLGQQSGQLTVSNVPIEPLNRLMALPVPVTGNLNSVATLGGNLFNPTVTGKANLVAAQVNDVPLEDAQVSFDYQQARLGVDGLVRLDNPEPLTLSASIPYALPFAAVTPSSDEIAVNVSLRDQGLGLINLLTDQVAWVDGQGRLALNVRGTLAQPLVNGVLKVQDATLTTPTLDNAISAVTGTAQFDQTQIQIPQLLGRYGKNPETAGTIAVSGALPIFDPELATAGLTVNLTDLDMKLKNLYNGEVEGNILVTGSALNPDIGGDVIVRNGKVVLTEVAAAGGTDPSAIAEGETAAPDEFNDSPSPITFNQLKVQLGDRVQIAQPPILSFIAKGDLVVNGNLSSPQPAGRISFDKGTINLFTNRFRVDSRRDNVAIFDPRYGVDPYLDIGMRSTVFEVVQGQTSELSDFKEVPASSLGSVESVKIYVSVDGLASKLQTNFTDVVEITSDPPRDEGTIVALLGGGVTDAVASGQVQNAALNVGSSAVLGNVRDLLADVLGNRVTVNAFPILLPNEDGDASVLSFGAEANYDVTNRFSVSAIQILTGTQQPTTFSLKYKLTDELRARTSISSDGQGVGLLEYRIRF